MVGGGGGSVGGLNTKKINKQINYMSGHKTIFLVAYLQTKTVI